ncbi:OmpH family outer membrane protein [uncultured Pelagimonas sp.]|uniref:OmpH family outer membrane protein n=1 Tax=uncultured Pelagimonas sp. TaxID=1618102 RepID=UPI002632C4BF|nr:OmpH family outer membrane protein [uncultured Pelagimonas sp.]
MALSVWTAGAKAQSVGGFDTGTVQSPVLVIEFDRAFSQSAFGQKLTVELETAGAEIAAENRQIETELRDEEMLLTDQRKAMEPAAFRELADAFDQKVQKLRREQDTKARELSERRDGARRDFLTSAGPILNRIMQNTNAVVVMEKRNVFASISAIDVTDLVISEINALFPQEPSDP